MKNKDNIGDKALSNMESHCTTIENIKADANIIKVFKLKLLQRWIYVALGIVIMLCLGTVYSWSVFRHSVENLYNVGATESGLPYMVALAFYSFFMFVTGKYLYKYNPRTVISTGGLLVASGWLLSAYATNIYILTITYGVISGAGVGIAYGVPMTVVSRWFPEKKGLVVGIVLVGFGLSPFISAPLARYLIESVGIIDTFKILGITFAIIIPIFSLPFKYPKVEDFKYLKEATNLIEEANNMTTNQMMHNKNFTGLYIVFIIGTMIGLMIIGITSNIGTELIKLSSKNVSLLMSLFAIFNGLGRPIFGFLTEKLSCRKIMIISYSLIIFASLLMLLAKANDISLFIIAFCIFWFNLGGWLAIAPTSTLKMFGTKYYSQNYGVVFTAYGIGAIIGVFISGILLDAFNSFYAIFYFIIIISFIGIVLSAIMIENEKL